MTSFTQKSLLVLGAFLIEILLGSGFVVNHEGLSNSDRYGNSGSDRGHSESDQYGLYCVTENKACIKSSSRVIESYNNINVMFGCSERCSELEDCNWWTWYDNEEKDSELPDCILYSNCSYEDENCNFCFSGEKENCRTDNLPQATVIIGGNCEESEITEVEVYSNKTGFVTFVMKDIPNDLKFGEVVAEVVGTNTNDVIILCGLNDDSSSLCYSYTIPILPQNEWVNVSNSMLTPRRGAAAVSAYGELYVTGGYSAVSPQAFMAVPFMEILNPATNIWRPVPNRMGPQPKSRAGHCALRHHDGIYLLGGESVARDILSVDVYNVTTQSWQNIEAEEVPNLVNLACAFRGNDVILISGGSIADEVSNRVWAWNLTSNLWQELSSLHVARHSHVMVNDNGLISVVGGTATDGATLNAFEKLVDNQWLLNPDGVTLNHSRTRFVQVRVPSDYVSFP